MKIKHSFTFILIVLLANLLAACTSDVKQAACSNQENFDPIFRQCVPKALGTSVQIQSSFPDLSYSVNVTTTTPTTHSISVTDPFNQGYQVQWFLFQVGSSPTLVASAQETYQVIPNTLSPGIYTLEVLLKDFDNVRILGKRTWSIVVNNLTAPSLSNPIPVLPSINFESTDPLSSFQIRVDNPDMLSGHTLSFFLDGNPVSVPAIPSGVPFIDLAYGFNPGSVAVGSHVLQAFLKDPGNITIDTYTWGIFVNNPALPGFSLEIPSIANTITVIDGVTLSSNGFFITDISGNLVTTDLCVETDNFVGTSTGTTVQFFALNAPTGAKFPIHAIPIPFTANGLAGRECLSGANGAYNIILANPQIGEVKFVRAEMRDNLTGDLSDTRTWTLSVRPKNEAPLISIASPPSGVPIAITQDSAAVNFSFSVTDSDSNITPGMIDPDQFETNFLMTGFVLDGSLVDPPQLLARPDCAHVKLSGQSTADKFGCQFTFPSWGSSGPVAPGVRVLSTSVMDTANPLWGGADLPSNTLNWSVNILEAQTAPEIVALPVGRFNFEDPGLTGTPVGPINEGDSVRVIFNVRDEERDHFKYTIKRCTAIGTGCTPLIVDAVYTRTNGERDALVFVDDSTNQGIVVGALSATIYYEISVTDIPDSVAGLDAPTTVLDSVGLVINNYNPAPEFPTGTLPTDAIASPNTSSTQQILTGFPFTFSPGPITDTSITDGDVLEYQWQVCNSTTSTCSAPPTTSAWHNITGATEANLTWTPPNNTAGDTLHIRVCIGDNGFGNNVSDCGLYTTWTSINVMSNLASNTSTGTITALNEFDSWFDAVTRRLYTAHQYNDGTDNRIKVNISHHDVATPPSFTEFSFKAFDDLGPGVDVEIESLSMTGAADPLNPGIKSLYISYLAKIPAMPGFDKQLRVRRIDISDTDNIYFNYRGIGLFNLPGSPCFPSLETLTQTAINPDDANCALGDAIEINGVRFEVTAPLTVNSSSGSNFRDALHAAILAASSDTRLANLTSPPFATVIGSLVVIDHTALKRDYIDDTRSSVALGNIMHDGSKWFIPSIDSPTGSKLLFYQGSLTGQLQANASGFNDACSIASTHCQLIPSSSSDSLLELDAKMSIASSPGVGNVFMAVRTIGNTVNAYRIPPTNLASITTNLPNIFPGDDIQNLQIAPSKPNNLNAFIAGQNMGVTDKQLSVIKIPITGDNLPASCGSCDKQVNINDNGTNITKDLVDYKILSSPISDEAFLATVSSASPSLGRLVMGSITGTPMEANTNMSPVLSLSDTIYNAAGKNSFVMTETVAPNVSISGIDFGVLVPAISQSNRNALFMSYFRPGGTNLNNPQSAVININSEATMRMNIEANDTAATPLFMMPYISN